jgi:hypothetical protein
MTLPRPLASCHCQVSNLPSALVTGPRLRLLRGRQFKFSPDHCGRLRDPASRQEWSNWPGANGNRRKLARRRDPSSCHALIFVLVVNCLLRLQSGASHRGTQ